MNQEIKQRVTYMGRPLSELTRAELEDALIAAHRLLADAQSPDAIRHRVEGRMAEMMRSYSKAQKG